MSTQKINISKINKTVFFIFILSLFFVSFTKSFAEINNRIKVCKEVTCTDYGIIDFEISGDSPLIIDSEKGLSGKVWGDELGWVTFNPPDGGVFFADLTTGILKGTAWSETSGVINFSVTGQKVVIDPKTGEWNGWAWASGPYGGWIKFDCQDASCVRTIWRDTAGGPTSYSLKVKEITNDVLNNFSASSIELFNKTISMIEEAYAFLHLSVVSFRNYLLE